MLAIAAKFLTNEFVVQAEKSNKDWEPTLFTRYIAAAFNHKT